MSQAQPILSMDDILRMHREHRIPSMEEIRLLTPIWPIPFKARHALSFAPQALRDAVAISDAMIRLRTAQVATPDLSSSESTTVASPSNSTQKKTPRRHRPQRIALKKKNHKYCAYVDESTRPRSESSILKSLIEAAKQ